MQIAAPALVATLIADVALGFLGKASPQLPVLFIGLAVKNLLGPRDLIGVVAYWPHRLGRKILWQRICTCSGERLLHPD